LKGKLAVLAFAAAVSHPLGSAIALETVPMHVSVATGGLSGSAAGGLALNSATAADFLGAELAVDNETLAEAQKLFRNKQYEEAAAALTQVPVDALSSRDRRAFEDLSGRVASAVDGRKEARVAFAKGEEMLAGGNIAGAIEQYKAAASNKYADTGTRNKALEQSALAENARKNAAVIDAAKYAEAVALVKSGDTAAARPLFEELSARGYKAGAFQKSPAAYLKDIGGASAAPVSAAPVTADPVVAAPVVAAPVVAAPVVAAPAVVEPVQASAVVTEPAPAAVAPAAVAAPVLVDNSAADLAAAEAKAQEEARKAAERDAAKAQREALAQQREAEKAAKAEADKAARLAAAEAKAANAATAEARATEARRLYNAGRDAYRVGDWVEARKSFVAASEAGYKAGLFEDSPEKFLSRMDRKEAADAAKAAKLAADQAAADAAAAAPAVTTPTVVAAAPAASGIEQVPAQNIVVSDVTPAAQPVAVAPAAPVEQVAVQQVPVQQVPAQQVPLQAIHMEPAPAGQVVVAEPVVVQPPSSSLQQTAELDRVRAEQSRAEAAALVTRARAAQADNQLAAALEMYTRAAMVDPSNTQAAAGRDELAALTGRAPAATSTLSEAERLINARRQVTQFRFDSAVQKAKDSTVSGDFADARRQIEQARIASRTERTIFSSEELASFDEQIAAAQGELDRESARVGRAEQEQIARDAASEEASQLNQKNAEKQRSIAQLIRRSRQLTEQGQYEQAVGVIDQILVIDPLNDYALGVRPLVEDRAIVQQQRRFRSQQDRQFRELLNEAEEKKIPYTDILRFPENWPDISDVRERTIAEERGLSTADQTLRRALERSAGTVEYRDTPLAEVFEDIARRGDFNLDVNYRALEALGIDRNTPVALRLRDVSFARLLRQVIESVAPPPSLLDYTAREGVVTVTSKEAINQDVFSKVYDIRDLLIVLTPIQIQNQQFGQVRSADRGNSQNPFQGGGSTTPEDLEDQQQELLDDLVELMEQTITPDSWISAGGNGSVNDFNGTLIVTQTDENHRRIDSLFKQLREAQSVQVTIETRFLTVQRNFLEDVGLDVDFDLNIDGSNSQRFGSRDENGNFQNNIPIEQNSSSLTRGVSTGVPGSLGGLIPQGQESLNLGVSYLDDFAVDVVLRATQASQRSKVLTAPRITLQSGNEASIVVGTVTYFVGDLELVANTNNFNPQPSSVTSGITFYVRAWVSDDRRFVTLNLQPSLTRLESLQSFTFQEAPQNAGGGGTGTTEIPPTASFQLPVISVTQLQTTVRVPDNGTLLLGGQTLAGEVEREAGVPVLSKIPFLKRLFTNRSNAKDEQVLLILVKPTIVIAREVELQQFPQLGQNEPVR
jgi:general secretion pathway protein D